MHICFIASFHDIPINYHCTSNGLASPYACRCSSVGIHQWIFMDIKCNINVYVSVHMCVYTYIYYIHIHIFIIYIYIHIYIHIHIFVYIYNGSFLKWGDCFPQFSSKSSTAGPPGHQADTQQPHQATSLDGLEKLIWKTSNVDVVFSDQWI